MRLAITTHAVERWAELSDPPLGLREARAELQQAVAQGAPERCGTTRRGQAVFRVEQPRHAYLVVKLGPDVLARTYQPGRAAGLIVTVLTPGQWERPNEVDEAAEIEQLMLDAITEREVLRGTAAEIRTAEQSLAQASVPPAPDVPAGGPLGTPSKAYTVQHESRGDWRSYAWTIATIERESRIIEMIRYTREEMPQLRAIATMVGKVLSGQTTLADLEDTFEHARPGVLATLRAKYPRPT